MEHGHGGGDIKDGYRKWRAMVFSIIRVNTGVIEMGRKRGVIHVHVNHGMLMAGTSGHPRPFVKV